MGFVGFFITYWKRPSYDRVSAVNVSRYQKVIILRVRETNMAMVLFASYCKWQLSLFYLFIQFFVAKRAPRALFMSKDRF